MLLKPIVFPDVELAVCDFLRTALADYTADSITVGTHYDGAPKAVTIRRDGGPRLDAVREVARLGVSVYVVANNDQPVNDLARMVCALLGAMADGLPVVKVTQTAGPIVIPEAGSLTHRYATFELIVRGSELQELP